MSPTPEPGSDLSRMQPTKLVLGFMHEEVRPILLQMLENARSGRNVEITLTCREDQAGEILECAEQIYLEQAGFNVHMQTVDEKTPDFNARGLTAFQSALGVLKPLQDVMLWGQPTANEKGLLEDSRRYGIAKALGWREPEVGASEVGASEVGASEVEASEVEARNQLKYICNTLYELIQDPQSHQNISISSCFAALRAQGLRDRFFLHLLDIAKSPNANDCLPVGVNSKMLEVISSSYIQYMQGHDYKELIKNLPVLPKGKNLTVKPG